MENQWNSKELKGDHRKSEEIEGNQRKSKNTKENQQKQKEIGRNHMKSMNIDEHAWDIDEHQRALMNINKTETPAQQ